MALAIRAEQNDILLGNEKEYPSGSPPLVAGINKILRHRFVLPHFTRQPESNVRALSAPPPCGGRTRDPVPYRGSPPKTRGPLPNFSFRSSVRRGFVIQP